MAFSTKDVGACFQGMTYGCTDAANGNHRQSGTLSVLADGSLGEGKSIEILKQVADWIFKDEQQNELDRLFIELDNQADFYGISLSAILATNGHLYWASAGANRLYLYRDGMLGRITREHLQADELDLAVVRGKVNKADTEKFQDGNRLTSYIGKLGKRAEGRLDNNVRPFLLKDGDLLVLCSNSLYSALEDSEISAVLAAWINRDMETQENCDAARLLVEAAERKDSQLRQDVAVNIIACRGALPKPLKAKSSLAKRVKLSLLVLMITFAAAMLVGDYVTDHQLSEQIMALLRRPETETAAVQTQRENIRQSVAEALKKRDELIRMRDKLKAVSRDMEQLTKKTGLSSEELQNRLTQALTDNENDVPLNLEPLNYQREMVLRFSDNREQYFANSLRDIDQLPVSKQMENSADSEKSTLRTKINEAQNDLTDWQKDVEKSITDIRDCEKRIKTRITAQQRPASGSTGKNANSSGNSGRKGI